MASRADRLEPALFRHHWDDGLLDLFAGVGVVGIGICWAFDLVALGAIVPAVLVPFWAPLRRRLVEPRAGLVEFSDARTEQNRRLGTSSAWLGVAMLALFTLVYLRTSRGESDVLAIIVPGVPALLLGLLAAVAGLGLGLPRFLAYAGLLGLCGVGVAVVDARPEVAMIAGGLLMLLGGARLMNRFLRLEVDDGEPS
jgi:hypothetical protein